MYDLVWAEGILDEFEQEHWLAAQKANQLYNIRRASIVGLIAHGDSRWRGYKALVKHVQKDIIVYVRHWKNNERCRQKYLTFDQYLKVNLKRRSYPALLDLVDSKADLELF